MRVGRASHQCRIYWQRFSCQSQGCNGGTDPSPPPVTSPGRCGFHADRHGRLGSRAGRGQGRGVITPPNEAARPMPNLHVEPEQERRRQALLCRPPRRSCSSGWTTGQVGNLSVCKPSSAKNLGGERRPLTCRSRRVAYRTRCGLAKL